MLIQLPNGLLDGVDLFDYADIDELRGKQQNYLADRELVVGNIGHVPKILEEMIKSLQTKEGLTWKGKISDAVWKLSSGDIETILIKIRENTYGPRFYHEADCSHCSKKNKNLRLDLNKLEIDKMSLEEMTKKKVIKLPKGDVEVELKPVYLNDLFEAIKITTQKQNSLITCLVAVSLKRIGDKSPVTSADVENLAASDIKFINDSVEYIKLEGGIDTDLEITCSGCGKDFTAKLNCLEASFFDPTRGSTS